MNTTYQRNNHNSENKLSNSLKNLNHAPNIEHAIQIKNLTKKFRDFIAVNDISFNVEKGHIHGFIGPNGAGKTTTIKCLISSMIFNTGEILVNNLPSTSLKAKKLVGYIPEKAIFPKGISTKQFLISMCQLNGFKRLECAKNVEAKLQQFDLAKFQNKSPNSFSSGMKKKVLLIQSLVNNPQIIIMDEPAANLDPTARTELFEDLKELRSQGKTVFISSHILSELQEIVDSVTILNHGKVVYSGSTKNNNQTQYEIRSSDNPKLLELLNKNKFNASHEKKLLLVEAKSNAEINKISKLALDNQITIYAFNLQTTNLQRLYEELVIDAPKENK